MSLGTIPPRKVCKPQRGFVVVEPQRTTEPNALTTRVDTAPYGVETATDERHTRADIAPHSVETPTARTPSVDKGLRSPANRWEETVQQFHLAHELPFYCESATVVHCTSIAIRLYNLRLAQANKQQERPKQPKALRFFFCIFTFILSSTSSQAHCSLVL